MEENVVIVESPAKAKTIEKFLGKGFVVKSSYGHIRDLSKKNYGIDIDNGYIPHYVIPEEKKKVVSELEKAIKKAQTVWLASDEDREGEAIAWHLAEVLELKEDKTKRIVFHEITKEAISNAVKNPRPINKRLVEAQQARRILDRLVGFELSPVLWKKVKQGLSAGRVQSVAVRLLVEREREIMGFKSSSSYRVIAAFEIRGKDSSLSEFKAELPKRFNTKKEVLGFLESCRGSEYKVTDIVSKPSKKSPAPPFTTSTLQQEASRKLGFSVSQTMSVAQRLYEAGLITYMRTDSVNISQSALNSAKNIIESAFGEKYVKIRRYKTKSKSAQEAHEAIRPTYLEKTSVEGTRYEKKLYELIRKRTIASQMSDAQIEKTTATIGISGSVHNFIATGEALIFDGFLKVYIESTDDEQEPVFGGLLPPLKAGDKLKALSVQATERFTHHPPRYTEASLVKKLEELGIGRPSTYAPTISTIQNRGYVEKEDRPGKSRNYNSVTLKENRITEEVKTETAGAEKAKLFPNDIGMLVCDFLIKYFPEIMDYNFTASVEEEFDLIAEGKLKWVEMIDKFYVPFHKKVETTLETSERSKGERLLGKDPVSGKNVYVKIGRFGPMAQMGETDNTEKPRFAGLRKGQHLETITLEEALELFRLPRKLGEYENSEVVAGVGRFGPFVRHDSKFYSLRGENDDPLTVTLDRAVEVIEEKRKKDREKIIKTLEKGDKKMTILKGRWGPFISFADKNYRLPKDADPEKLDFEECMLIIKNSKPKGKKRKAGGRKKK